MATLSSKAPSLHWEQGWEQPALQPVLDALPFAAALVNSAGSICAANRLWLALSGAALPGQSYADFCRGLGAAGSASGALATGIRDVLSGRQSRFPFDGPDGCRIIVTPYRDRELEGALILRQQAGGDVQPSPSDKMETLGRMLAGVTHDFANLITLIATSSEILLRRVGRDDPLRDYLEQIRLAADKGEQLTAQLLDVARSRPRKPSLLDLNRLVAEQARMLRSVIGENIEWETRLSPGLGLVWMEAGQLERVFLNLALNARDAMPGGGRIVVATANRVLGGEEASEQGVAPGPGIEVTVSDTGEGIAPETMAHIFEPLFTTKQNGRGTGLGLSTVSGIVRQNGGLVQVRSLPGRGTTFTVWLPQATPACGIPDAATPETPGADAGKETILLVEDDGTVRRLFAHILAARGYTVLEASGGEEALDIFGRRRDEIDLLCTDLVMPVVSGRELAERTLRQKPDLGVVYMSGYSTDALLSMGLLAPGVSYLQKPLRPDTLAAGVRQTLDRSGRRAAAVH